MYAPTVAMNSTLQTVLALVAVAAAVAYLTWHAWQKRKRSATGACGSSDEGCGCSGKIKVPSHLAKRS